MFGKIVDKNIVDNYAWFQEQIKKKKACQYEGKRIKAPIYNWSETIQYGNLGKKLEKIYKRIIKENPS